MKTRSLSILLAAILILLFSLSPAQAEVNVTAKMKLPLVSSVFKKSAGTTSNDYRLKNTSTALLSGPFKVVVESIDNRDVFLTNPDGYTPEGKPYMEYTDSNLDPTETSNPKTWIFDHGCKKRITVTIKKLTTSWQLKFQPACSNLLTVYVSIFSSEVGANHTPVAHAGRDQTVKTGETVYLDGSQSSEPDGDPLTYIWSVISKPEKAKVVLSDPNSVRPSFKAKVSGSYVFGLTVSDGELTSTRDTCVITTGNSSPVANAGPNQTVMVGDEIYLDGSKSTDADGNSLKHNWSMVSRPEGSMATLTNPDTVRPSFTVDQHGTYVLQLIVNHGSKMSTPDFTLISTENSPPQADAGRDQTVTPGSLVQLDGSRSTDVDGDLLTCKWSILSKPDGSIATLSNPASIIPLFTADQAGNYVIQLIVNDGLRDSLADTVVISTDNSPPTAKAGDDQTVDVGDEVFLDGNASIDPDGDLLTYKWAIISKPKGKPHLSDPDAVAPSFIANKAGAYVLQLTVSDGLTTSLPDTVVISTQNSRPVADAGADKLINLMDTVSLNGSGSWDADEDPLTYFWSILYRPQGSNATLSDPTLLNPTFVVDVKGAYILQLIVNDGLMDSYPDTVKVGTIVVMTSVPNVVGLTQSEAESAITGATLTVGTITTAYSATVPQGDVISQNPLAGTSLPEGSWVSFVVSLGPHMVTVPTLIGMSEAQAEAALAAAGLVVGTTRSLYSYTVSANHVMSQTPAAGALVLDGTTVNFEISLGTPVTPPDPSTVAPEVDPTVATTLPSATEFIYTGTNPIQIGVAPETIEPKRVAVLRGKVLTQGGGPLSGVIIAILNHPEYGQTVSRADGMFDMVVNGGGYLNVRYERAGYLTVQRQRDIPWGDYMWLPEVRMIEADPNVTFVDLTSQSDFQIIQGSVMTDERGTRQSTILIPKGTQAWMVFPDGHEEPITSLNVRATEYTVGADGEKKMPAELPPTSAYTYCEEFTVEEAVAAGAPEVRFSQPVISYNENFLDFPVGTGIPLGAYDRERGVWIPSDNGKTIKIISITNGLAELDTDGNGTIDNGISLGITDAERATLTTLYQAEQTLWRVLVPHFTRPWDKNMGTSCEPPCPNPDTPPPWEDAVDGTCWQEGSIIECQNQALGQTVDVTGTPYRLFYKSDRVPGRTDAFTLDVPLSSPVMSPTLQEITLTARIAGQEIHRSFKKEDFDFSNLSYPITWDGRDAYGRFVQGRQQATFEIGYSYKLIYQSTDRFGYNGNGTVMITGGNLFNILKTHKTWMGIWDARGQGLGGWTLDIHHSYDPQERVIYYGDGSKRSASSIGRVVTTVAGGGSPGDNKPAIQSFLWRPKAVAFARDGSYYIAEGHLVRRVDTDGIITTVAGTGVASFGGDSGPATAALLNGPSDVAVGPDGSVYIADTGNHRIRRIGPDGIITTFAGNGNCLNCEYNCPPLIDVPATQAVTCRVSNISFGPDGSLYLLHGISLSSGKTFIRRVGPDGIMSKVAGEYYTACGPEGALAKDLTIGASAMAVGPDGSVYYTASCPDPGTGQPQPRLWRIDVDGKVRKVAGNGAFGSGGDGGPAKEASLHYPGKVGFGPDGSLYLPIYNPACVRVISPDGLINTIADNCLPDYGFAGDNGLATQATFHLIAGATPGPDGSLYIADGENGRIRRVALGTLPGITDSDLLIPSEDGAEAYLFNSQGKHLRTYNALTAAVKYTFGYNANGFLITVTDGDGNVTTIERDGADRPLAIVSPYGQHTTLTLDSNGYLRRITNPAAETVQFVYTGNGLMTGSIDPRGGLYQFTYNGRGRLTGETDPAGGSRTLSLTRTSTAFDVTHTTGMNRVTNYRVERLGTGDEHWVNTFPSGVTTDSLLRKKDGNETLTFPDGTIATEQLGPDPRFGMQAPVLKSQTIAMPSTLTATATAARTAILSASDNPLTLTSLKDEFTINGRKYTTNYTASTKTVTDTSPAGRQATSKIDSQGRMVEYQFPSVLPVQFTYDAQGRLTSARQGSEPELRESTYQYNAQGFLQVVTDPLLRTMSFEYDQAGRVTRNVLPDGRDIIYAYDTSGNVIALTPPGRPPHAFSYTAVDLMAEYTPPDIGIGTVKTQYSYNSDRQLTQVLRPDGLAIDFGYDSGGRMSEIVYPGGPVTFTYDAVKGYLSQINGPDGNSISYAYDGLLVTGETWAGAVTGSMSWAYDNSFRITGISVNGGNATTYQYDNDNQLTKTGDLTLTRNAQNGLLTSSTLGNVTDAWTYDSFGEPASYIANYGATEIFKQQFTYDKLGRIAQKIETVEGVINTYDYHYDSTGRLDEVKKNGSTVSTYTYDSNDNRLTGPSGTTTYSYDAQDRLVTQSSVLNTQSYSYTANGELQSKTTGGSTTLYNYDVFGNLRSVTLPGGTLIEYPVDGQNRRLGKKANGTWVRKLVYLNQLKPAAELDASDAVVSLFIYGSRFIVPDYMVKGAVTYRIIADHLGSPRLVVNTATGDIVQRMDYDEFGNVINDTNPGFQPFGFAAGLYDPDTTLVRLGVRDYDAKVGRWTVKDLIMFDGGQDNLYVYAGNDPINQIDVLGTIIFGGGGKKPEVPTPNSNIRPPREAPAPQPRAEPAPEPAPRPAPDMDWLRRWHDWKRGGGIGPEPKPTGGVKGFASGLAKCLVIFTIIDAIDYARNPDAWMRKQPICMANPGHPACPDFRKLPAQNGYVIPGRYRADPLDTGKLKDFGY